MNKREIEILIRMMHEWRDYWIDRYDYLRHSDGESYLTGEVYGAMTAYDTCAYFLELALAGDWESLNQYDSYGDEN